MPVRSGSGGPCRPCRERGCRPRHRCVEGHRRWRATVHRRATTSRFSRYINRPSVSTSAFVAPASASFKNASRAAGSRRSTARLVTPQCGVSSASSRSLSQTRLRLGPHPPGQPRRSENLDRTRGLHPQPDQDRRHDRLKPDYGKIHDHHRSTVLPPFQPPTGRSGFFRSK
jgi:hypothetical protein